MGTRVLGVALAAAVAAPIALAGQAAPPASSSRPAARPATSVRTSYQVPRTPWGHPDLQGTWDYRTITPLERPQQYGDREFYTDAEVKEMEARAAKRMDEPPAEDAPAATIHPTYWTDPGRFVAENRRTSLIIDPPNGRIPPPAGGRGSGGRRGGGAGAAAPGGRGAGGGAPARTGGRADSWADRTVLERCITWGLPTNLLPGLYNNNIRIVQSPTSVAITHEMVHDTRVIPLERPSALPRDLAGWLGHSTARWEGETLVVETSNFNGRVAFRGATTNLRLTERYTRTGKDRVELRLTVEDATTWSAPWTIALTMRTSEGPLFEYACHEGNYGLRNILEVARDEEKAAEAAGTGQK